VLHVRQARVGRGVLRKSYCTAATLEGQGCFRNTGIAEPINQWAGLKELIIHQHQLLDENRNSVQSLQGR